MGAFNELALQPTLTENTGLNQKRIDAERLHAEIVVNCVIISEAIVNIAVNLKKMRDSKLYLEFGYETFEEYCEDKAGIRQRQAYNYIHVLEENGEDYMRINSKLGITKLVELTRLADADREELEETVDLEKISIRDLQDKINKLQNKCDQLTLENREYSNIDDEIAELNGKNAKLEKELEELKNNPIDVIMSKPTAEQLKKIRNEIKKELNEEKAASDKELSEAISKLKELEKENQDLQSTAKIFLPSGNKELLKYHFNEMQTAFNAAVEVIGRLEGEESQKFTQGFTKLLEQMLEKLS